MNRTVLAAVLSVLLGLAGCAAVVVYARQADERALHGQRAVRVLLARVPIPAGTTGQALRDGQLTEVVTMPASSVPSDALSRIEEALLPLVVTADLRPRQLLLRGSFGEAAPNSGGLRIPAGQLAVTVAVRMPSAVAGYVQPGALVAVYDTFNVAEGKGARPVPAGDGLTSSHTYNQATRLLLSGALVLAVGGRAAGSNPDAATGTSGGLPANDAAAVPVTVAVTAEDAVRLVHAAQTGVLYLALLGGGTELHVGDGVDNTSLFPGG
jgi:pilus assembly protein CpaB